MSYRRSNTVAAASPARSYRTLLLTGGAAALLFALTAAPAAGQLYPPPAGPEVTIENPGATIDFNTDDGRLIGGEVTIERDGAPDETGPVLPQTTVSATGTLASIDAAELEGVERVRVHGTDGEGNPFDDVYEVAALLGDTGGGDAAADVDGDQVAEAHGDDEAGEEQAAAGGDGEPLARTGLEATAGLAAAAALLGVGAVALYLARRARNRLTG